MLSQHGDREEKDISSTVLWPAFVLASPEELLGSSAFDPSLFLWFLAEEAEEELVSQATCPHCG